jgi:hypothetical protein
MNENKGVLRKSVLFFILVATAGLTSSAVELWSRDATLGVLYPTNNTDQVNITGSASQGLFLQYAKNCQALNTSKSGNIQCTTISGISETDTLETVTTRGNRTNTPIIINGTKTVYQNGASNTAWEISKSGLSNLLIEARGSLTRDINISMRNFYLTTRNGGDRFLKITDGGSSTDFDAEQNSFFNFLDPVQTSSLKATSISGNIGCGNITGGSDSDYCTDATGVGASASYMFAGGSSASISADSTCTPNGDTCVTTTTNGMRIPISVTLHNLTARISSAPSGNTCIFTVRTSTNSCTSYSATALTCTILSGATTCSNVANAVSVTANSCIQVFFDENTVCAGLISWGFMGR